mmetsp:Transcript_30589/g.63893  ORF Transcript_30589/g.63893 Transcript_30589/m.63893 type:complete len:145 (-) Transcript_30589:121-555(-)
MIDLPRVALTISAVVNIILMVCLVLIPETCVNMIYGIGPLDPNDPSGEVALFLGAGASAYAGGVAIMMILALVDKSPGAQKLALTSYGYACVIAGLYTLLPFPIAFPGPLSRRIFYCCQCFVLALLNLVAATRVYVEGYTTILE